MKYALYLLAVIYITGIIFFFSILNSDQKKEKINITNIKKSIVIIIPEKKLISYNNNPKGLIQNIENSGIGAGFFINNEGLIQTVNHLVENENINYKVIYEGIEYDSEIISRDKEYDLAKLKIKTTSPLTPLLKGDGKKNEPIISFGINSQNLEIIYNTGIILNTQKKLDIKSSLIEISNDLKPGFSGGPILNQNGRVIGINYAISHGKNYAITLPLKSLQ